MNTYPRAGTPNKGHQKKAAPPISLSNLEGQFEYDVVNGGDPNVADTAGRYEYPMQSMVTWCEEASSKARDSKDGVTYIPLIDIGITEFIGTTLNVFMASLVFSIVYNAQAVPVGGLLSDRLSDYILVVLTIGLTATATHAGFWSESAKFNSGISLATMAVAQSNANGGWFNLGRFIVEVGTQVCGGILGAGLSRWVGPVTLQRTYMDAGYPFYNTVLSTKWRAFWLQTFGIILITYMFTRVQYAPAKKTRLSTQSIMMGSAYGAAALITYYSGSCTTFVRWLGAAIITGIANIETAPTTLADATGDNVASAGWVYYGSEMLGAVIGVILYIFFYRTQYGTFSSTRKISSN